MLTETAQKLCDITSKFYRDQCDSFSATRQAPWMGWKRCAQLCREEGLGETGAFSVLDLACGNLRFESYFEEEFGVGSIRFYAVDNCDALAGERDSVAYQSLDIVGVLCEGAELEPLLDAPVCDLAVSFGFMHHIPLVRQREAVLRGLVSRVRPGGLVAVSFWQFLNDEGLAHKAGITHAAALEELALPPLDEGDFMLGWKGLEGAYRYCHNFSHAEIEQLASSVADRAQVVEHFAADGRTGNLNAYLVLRVY